MNSFLKVGDSVKVTNVDHELCGAYGTIEEILTDNRATVACSNLTRYVIALTDLDLQ